jgi:hypothetical protein
MIMPSNRENRTGNLTHEAATQNHASIVPMDDGDPVGGGIPNVVVQPLGDPVGGGIPQVQPSEPQAV